MRHDPARHSIIVCNRCIDPRQGLRAAEQLKAELATLMSDEERSFLHIDDIRCMAGCERPTAVAFTAPGKATYLFGDIDPATHAPDLMEFARLYRSLPDGWCNERQRPRGLAGRTLARVPALAFPDVPR